MKRLLMIAAALAMLASKSHKDAYILASEEGITFSSGTDLTEWKAIRKAYPGKMLWVRHNGRDYLIRDETFILRARALFASQAALAPEYAALSREEVRLDREEERLEEAPRTAENERRLAEVHAQQRDLERREKVLDEREAENDRALERELWPLVDTAIRSGLAKPLNR